MRRVALALLVALALAACSSTAGPVARTHQASALPPGTQPRSSAGSYTAAARPSAQAAQATAVPASEGPQTPSMAKLRIGGERYATLGSPDAAVTMVEFSDYGCPFCRLYSASAFPEIKQRFIDTGHVYYVFKDFPVVELHPQAVLAAQAAECAGEQGGYWQYHARLFSDPREWEADQSTAVASFGRYADELGLDAAALSDCIGAGRYAGEVGIDFAEARSLGLSGTPVFIINGKLLSGARAAAQFVAILEREVEQAGE